MLDKFDADQAVDEVSNAIGAPPKIVVPDEQVAEIRAQRAQQQAAAQAAELAANTGQTSANLMTADLGQDTLLSRGIDAATT